MFNKITNRSFGFNLLVVVGILAVLGLLFFSLLGIITKHGDTLTVPDVYKKNIQEATMILEKEGFSVDVRDSIYVDSLPGLAVWEQTPAKGSIVKVGRTIYLTINKVIPPMVQMPDLNGLTFRSAEMTLHSLRLNVGDTIYKPDFATNTVLQQLLNGKVVKPGREIPEGSNITLVLSSGTGNTENPAPDLIGLTFLEAKETLSASNLGLGTVLIDPSVTDTANAFVVKQTPPRRNSLNELNMVRAGETIDLWLSGNRPTKDSGGTPAPPAEPEQPE
ncbi:PASTA domain-containing protein [Chitinophaga ginsengisoli]|uniref:Beta-lactam-binding protein with PASTA domain n=1 Tax=Chitinophaga ginsengisoli TaxID=363837 RepID=A0A2P8FW65_9BACT|nr:PASTA domain-containing protein [Chitinophaga ginsengisoli]PSL25959.1 beta-lactam-binding protein with PASTA domain [Chitinophaga ginsengisoli]